MAKMIDSSCGVFVGQRFGDCIRLSVPAETDNDWTHQGVAFIDLPLMDEETFDEFIKSVTAMKTLFGGEE